MIVNDCATGTLAPYVPTPDKPWDKKRVMHLYRRIGYGIKPQDINSALGQSPTTLIDQLIDDTIGLPAAPEPVWAYWTQNEYDDFFAEINDQYLEWMRVWLTDMLENGMRGKLTLFWHNHFVTKSETYLCPSYMYQYYKVLETYSMGNFKDFVKEMGKTPAMLFFLNGYENTKINPNENYARELYELFTLGVDNGYTQEDIEETARALTGYNGLFVFCGEILFVNDLFDDGEKTIFGQTGNWNYDDVHDILFTERADEIAHFVCTKLYKNFISPEVDEDIVNGLASTFKNNNFELAPVYRQLFKSEHFFDESNISNIIKSPIDMLLTFSNEGNLTYNDNILNEIAFYSSFLGQELTNPIDVAGWQGNRSWISSSTLVGRWQVMALYSFFQFQNYADDLQALAIELSGGDPTVTDPYFVTQSIVDHFIPNGLHTAEAYERATIAFKGDIPENYFTLNLWNLGWDTVPIQMFLLFDFIVRHPEFQLT